MSSAPPIPGTRSHPEGCYRRSVGAISITTLHDGQFEAAFAYVQGISAERAEATERAALRPIPPRITVSAFLVVTDGRCVLIDTGGGTAFAPTVGRARDALAQTGVARERIDTVLLTHGHVDHVSGLIDSLGRPAFPNATIWLHEREMAFWSNDTIMAQGPDALKQAFAQFRKALDPYESRIETFGDSADENAPGVHGITPVPLPGHSPGHTGFMISSGGEQLLVWGDVVHLPGIQFRYPDASMVFDSDPAQAVATRKAILAKTADDAIPVAGMHLDFPTFGRVVRAGEGYAFTPEVWSILG